MLRRRRKTPKPAPPAPRGALRQGRRRARADAPVPAELLVTPGARGVTSAKAGAPSSVTPAKAGAPLGPGLRRGDRTHRGDETHRGTVLVTGFDPFCDEKSNPSWEICRQLPAAIGGLTVETCRVPCEFRRAIEVVAEAIERLDPALVLCLGQAGGRAHLGVERVAINVDDARAADNAGAKPIDEPIAARGPAAYFATVPIKAMVAAMREAGVPAEVSNSAGTYVCNHLMYGVLHFLAASGRAARAGFIHVPYSEAQVIDKPAVPAMALATMVRGVQAAIEAAHRHAEDLKIEGGTLD